MATADSQNGFIRTTSERALLGLLSLRPMSGYDLRQLIPQSIGNFWSESYGQIYPALKRMTTEGLLDKKIERGKGRPDRHVYSLTERGRDQLREWLEAPVETRTVPRDEMLLKVFFGGQATPSVIRRHIEAFMAEEELERAQHGAIARELKRSWAHHPELPYWLMTLNMGRHQVNAKMAWCRETLEELDQLERESNR